MRFEFSTRRNFNLAEELGEKIGVKANNNRIDFIEAFGKGFIKMIELGPAFQMVLNRFCLKDDFIIKRKALAGSRGLVTIAFYLHDKPVIFLKDPVGEVDCGIHLSSIHVTSTNLEIETRFAAGTDVHATVLIIPSELLIELLQTKKQNPILKEINSGEQSFWFDTSMTLDIQNVLKQIDHACLDEFLDAPYYKIKAYELTYLLFTELLREDRRQYQRINKEDIQKAYLVKDALLKDLSVQPTLAGLAEMICVSESKLKQLFRQIFGKSIYNFYQVARMNEAAVLLKECSVTQTGYKLGFVSMSHFSQLFKKYQGVTPQKFRNLIK